MAGRTRKRGAAAGLVPQHVATDLTATHGLTRLSGERVVDLARKTLDAGEGMVGAWTELEPIGRKLTSLVRQRADVADFGGKEALMRVREGAADAARVTPAAARVLRARQRGPGGAGGAARGAEAHPQRAGRDAGEAAGGRGLGDGATLEGGARRLSRLCPAGDSRRVEREGARARCVMPPHPIDPMVRFM